MLRLKTLDNKTHNFLLVAAFTPVALPVSVGVGVGLLALASGADLAVKVADGIKGYFIPKSLKNV